MDLITLAAARAGVSNMVSDIEALVGSVTGSVGIDDSHTGASTTWSSDKIQAEISAVASNTYDVCTIPELEAILSE